MSVKYKPIFFHFSNIYFCWSMISPFGHDLDNYYMEQALVQARKAYAKDEVPIGAVIAHKNRIIARAYNQVELLKDPTAHAEMIAITQATSSLSSKWLQDCTLYVTIEPCSMCAGALVLARIKRIYFASAIAGLS